MASCCPEIPRARFRVLFFALLAAVCAATGQRAGVAVAAVCFAVGIASILVAHARGRRLALTFVTIDWLGLGLVWAATGGSSSPFLYTLPVLLAAHLLPTPSREWLHVASPLAAGVAVMLIADPTLGGSRLLGFLKLAGLVLVGFAPVLLASRRRTVQCARGERRGANGRAVSRSRRSPRAPAEVQHATVARVPTVDPTTGFHGLPRVADLLTGMMRDAAASHEAVGVICLRLVHWQDIRGFSGELAAEAAAAAAARRLRRHLRADDLAFRVRGDTFLIVCRDRTTSRARALAAQLAAELDGQRFERSGERLSVASGVSSFPATASLEALLREAAAGAEAGERPAASAR
jgi:diguanylate cyclase (GGDEF)-like protein